MLYHHVTGNSLAEGLENALKVLHSDGIVYEGENQDREDKVKEISLVLNILNPLSEPMISKCMPSGLKGLMEYTEEFLRGSRDFEPYWEYTYHKLYAQYYDKFIDELMFDLVGSQGFGSQFFQCWSNRFAWSTPVCIKINQCGFIT